ncbi:MAG: hypothetical protein DSY40_02375 [Nautilia sp.]|nr:MAG: hypothetical protein DSY40_02375 [Nautilia sp.]
MNKQKKECLLEDIEMVERYINDNFKIMQTFVKLKVYNELEDFLNYDFIDNMITAIIFLSNKIEKY